MTNQIAYDAALSSTERADRRARRVPLAGFRPFFRKEIAEWWHSRRAGILLLATSALFSLATLGSKLDNVGDGSFAKRGSLDPTTNALVPWLTPMALSLVAIVTVISVLVSERASGTLAWNLAKPLSRSAVLTAKWVAGTVMYFVFGIVLPMTVALGVATVAYGGLPDVAKVASVALPMILLPIFYLALSIAVGAVSSSYAAVAGVSFAFLMVPAMAGSFLPKPVLAALPTQIGGWVAGLATATPVSVATPLGWLVGMALVALVAKFAFDRQEF